MSLAHAFLGFSDIIINFDKMENNLQTGKKKKKKRLSDNSENRKLKNLFYEYTECFEVQGKYWHDLDRSWKQGMKSDYQSSTGNTPSKADRQNFLKNQTIKCKNPQNPNQGNRKKKKKPKQTKNLKSKQEKKSPHTKEF